jgi:hypothetical protein
LFDTAGSVCFTNMAKSHMLGLERVQYRALRVAFIGSTPNNCLGVLSGIPSLAERFTYLNFKYLVAAYYRLGHPLRGRLVVLRALNIGHCIKEYFDVLSLDIIPFESYTRHELPAILGTRMVDGHMEKKLVKLLTVTSGYGASRIFYTNGSLIEGCAGFAVHQIGVGGFGHKILSPAGVFTAKLSALSTALRHW